MPSSRRPLPILRGYFPSFVPLFPFLLFRLFLPLPRTPTRCALFLFLVPLFFPLTGPYSFPSSSPLPRPMVGISLPKSRILAFLRSSPTNLAAPRRAVHLCLRWAFCRHFSVGTLFSSSFSSNPNLPFPPLGAPLRPPLALYGCPLASFGLLFPNFGLCRPFPGQISSVLFLPLLSLVLTFRPLGRRFPLSSDPALCHPASFTSPVAAPPPPAITPKSIPLIPSSTRSLSRL